MPKPSMAHFMEQEPQVSKAVVNPTKVKVSEERPLLESLPRATTWLVAHRVVSLVGAETRPANSKEDVAVEVTLCGNLGAVLQGPAEEAHNHSNRLAKHTAVRNWVVNPSKQAKAIKAHNFSSPSFWET